MYYTKGDFKVSQPIKNAIHSYDKQRQEAKTQFIRFAKTHRPYAPDGIKPRSAKPIFYQHSRSESETQHRFSADPRKKYQARSNNVSRVEGEQFAGPVSLEPRIEFGQYVRLRDQGPSPIPFLFDMLDTTKDKLENAKEVGSDSQKNIKKHKNKSRNLFSPNKREGAASEYAEVSQKAQLKIVKSILPYYLACLNKTRPVSEAASRANQQKLNFSRMKRIDPIPTLRVRKAI